MFSPGPGKFGSDGLEKRIAFFAAAFVPALPRVASIQISPSDVPVGGNEMSVPTNPFTCSSAMRGNVPGFAYTISICATG
jgi:hypothetical protein